MTHRTHRRAFTLVEMLVVVAIISILTAIAVPTLNRIGVFGRDPLNVASRQVLTMLKAARIYAGTHNVDTAVVYAMKQVTDSQTGSVVRVIDGCAIVRRLRNEDFPDLDYSQFMTLVGSSETANLPPFVPIRGRDGIFEMFPNGAVLGAYNTAYNPLNSPEPLVLAPENWPGVGLCAIKVLDPNDNFIALSPRFIEGTIIPINYQPGGAWPADAVFPAHVFKPSGILQTPDTNRSRYEIAVIPAPNAEEDERFVTNPDTGVKRLVPAERIEIFGTIGRIQSIDREPGIS